MNRRGFCLLLFFTFFFLFLASGEGQEKKGKPSEELPLKLGKGFGFKAGDAPIDITSDTVEADQKQNRVTFKGNVIAKQGDLTLYTNSLVVLYDQTAKKIKELQSGQVLEVISTDEGIKSDMPAW